MIKGTYKAFNKFYLSFFSWSNIVPCLLLLIILCVIVQHTVSHSMFISLYEYCVISEYLVGDRILDNKWEKITRPIARSVI